MAFDPSPLPSFRKTMLSFFRKFITFVTEIHDQVTVYNSKNLERIFLNDPPPLWSFPKESSFGTRIVPLNGVFGITKWSWIFVLGTKKV